LPSNEGIGRLPSEGGFQMELLPAMGRGFSDPGLFDK
jgi:hypothetical protein